MDTDQTYSDLIKRNIGIISLEEQKIIKEAKVAIAGCGADGGAPAISLARLGVKRFALADPDVFDHSNMNRQEGAYHSTLGKKKAEVIAKNIIDINPEAKVDIYEDGINSENVTDFLSGANIVLEEIDYRLPSYSLLIHKNARKLNLPVFTSVSVAWNAFLFYFDPKGMTYEEYIGIEDSNNSNIKSTDIDITAFAPEIPSYLSPDLIQDVLEEKVEIPAVDPGVRIASALLSSFCIYHLTKSRQIDSVPNYYTCGDIFLMKSKLNSR